MLIANKKVYIKCDFLTLLTYWTIKDFTVQ